MSNRLNELAPEPTTDAKDGSVPNDGPSTTSTVLRVLRSIQKYSAFSFSAFTAMHLWSVAVSPSISIDVANSSFMFTRTIYQSALGEPLLIFGSLSAHLLSGWALHAYRVYSAKANHGKWIFGTNAITNSGAALAVLVIAHILATRYSPLQALGDSSVVSLEFMTWALHDDFMSVTGTMCFYVTLYAYHAIGGFEKWFHFRLGYAKYAILALVGGLVASSLTVINNQPAPNPWLAGQYQIAHEYFNNLMGM